MTLDEVIAKLDNSKDIKKGGLSISIMKGNKEHASMLIQTITGCDMDIAMQAYDKKREEYLEKAKYREEHPEEFPKTQRYIPKCPTCGSPSVTKINGSKRWLSVGLFGVASSDVGKTMKCNNCGYKW